MKLLSPLSHLVADILRCPGATAVPYLLVGRDEKVPDSISAHIDKAAGTARFVLGYGELATEEHLLRWSARQIVWTRQAVNCSAKPMPLAELGMHFAGLSVGEVRYDDFCYHVENARVHGKMVLPVRLRRVSEWMADHGSERGGGTRWSDGGASERIGASACQPFPALALGNLREREGLVHGSLAQGPLQHVYQVKLREHTLLLDAISTFRALRGLIWQPGIMLEDRWHLGRAARADRLEEVFAEYLAALRRHLPPARQGRGRLTGAVPASEGLTTGLGSDRQLAAADFLAAELAAPPPAPRPAPGAAATVTPEPAPPRPPVMFPRTASRAPRPQPGDHPSPRPPPPAPTLPELPPPPPIPDEPPPGHVPLYRGPHAAPALPAAQPALEHLLDLLFDEPAQQAKYDAWLTDPADPLAVVVPSQRTEVAARYQWLREVRNRLPHYGLLQRPGAPVLANPFLAQHLATYCFAEPFAPGAWEEQRKLVQVGAACLALGVGDLLPAATDGIALAPGLSAAEAQFALTFAVISRTLADGAAWLRHYAGQPLHALVARAICCTPLGQAVHFAGYDYRDPAQFAPEVWYLETPYFARRPGLAGVPARTVAVFNLGDAARTWALTPAQFGLAAGRWYATQVWPRRSQVWEDELRVVVPARGCTLLALNPADGTPQVLDADHEVTASRATADGLELRLRHRGPLELRLDRAPTAATFVGRELPFQVTKGEGNVCVKVELPASGWLHLALPPAPPPEPRAAPLLA